MHIFRPDKDMPEVREYYRPVTTDMLHEFIEPGYLETVPLFETYVGERCVAFCHEEGKLKDLPFNQAASLRWAAALGCTLSEIGDHLVGTVVVITGDDEFMETI